MIERINVSFCLYSELEPPQITEVLNIQPDQVSLVEGHSLPTKYKKNWNGNYFWSLSSERHVSGVILDKHIDYVLNKLLDVEDRLRALLEQPSRTAGLKVSIWTDSGFEIGPTQCAKIARSGLNIRFYISDYSKADD